MSLFITSPSDIRACGPADADGFPTCPGAGQPGSLQTQDPPPPPPWWRAELEAGSPWPGLSVHHITPSSPQPWERSVSVSIAEIRKLRLEMWSWGDQEGSWCSQPGERGGWLQPAVGALEGSGQTDVWGRGGRTESLLLGNL